MSEVTEKKVKNPRYVNSELLECIQIVGIEVREENEKKKSQLTAMDDVKVNVGNCESSLINHTICKLYKWIYLCFGIKLSVFFKRVEDLMEQREQENKNKN